MQKFVRGNALVCSGTFAAVDGSATQPTNAEIIVVFTDTTGATTRQVVPLTLVNGVWSGAWDSAQAGEGYVDWTVHCWNGLEAATEGNFFIVANRANAGY